MPAAAKESLEDSALLGDIPSLSVESYLPLCVAHVPRESIRNFHHTKRVGNYLIGRKLGEGSFAKVREGLHILTGEKVAVKVIDKKKARKDSYVTKNLRREGQIHQMIKHPNITQLLDILETENSYYLVMELCTGGNLMHKMYDRKILEEAEARKYIRQLALAVEHLHQAGVVHRDLKIENLLLDEHSNIKLIDFGLSNCAGILGYSDPFSTQCGSPAYAAPELLARKKYGPKVDIWSIGVNAYAMLTGTLPFTVEPFSLRALHQKMVDKDMNPLPIHLSSVAVNFLKSLLEPDPIKRPNVHKVLADRWLNQNYPGKPECRVAYPNRLHPDDLNQSVVLHMSERLGYKYSEVVNTVLSNRASHTLSVYFLLDRKLDRYIRSFAMPDFTDGICFKNQLCQLDRYRLKEAREEKKGKEAERRGEIIHKPFAKKNEKGLASAKQSPYFAAPLNLAKAVHKERKAPKPDKGLMLDTYLTVPTVSADGASVGKNGCVNSHSLEYLEMQRPLPRTPMPIRPPLDVASPKGGAKDPCPSGSRTPVAGDERIGPAPQHGHNGQTGGPSYRSLPPALPHPKPPSSSPARTVPTCKEKRDSSVRLHALSAIPPSSGHANANELGNPSLVKSRGKFPMMGIGQMLRKRNQAVQLRPDKPAGPKLS
ncbi:hormonally up-regulated neu tumor-associated kinase homolog A [Callorhinchus milii]|uniref:hormonally up-regulated neu tumor-associated kinase homolog A n=1 Tax=Callorhinchus milii TaxID=7868 RepID=UPI0004575A45|nr:hormonally up-regulated neu tumor-associated kinase homolog A [Callorhinchus milii]|eukprot:gi/632976621/ref/XP_007904897.1/ PREDICTED: hormonally up-regulated neu tumor-associated kinase [Callorhinchus milii]